MKKGSKMIRVQCVCNNSSIPGACVSLIDSLGKTVQQQCTDNCGCVSLPLTCADNYRIRAQVPCSHSPKGQNRWAYLTADNNYHCMFMFQDLYYNEETGTLEIIITDANYPEYLLDKGEITLWHGLK